MNGRWKLSLVLAGLKNLSPRTKRMAVFWTCIVVLAEVVVFLSGEGGIWQAVMLAATVALIIAVEIGQDIKRYINSQPEPEEESLPKAIARTAADPNLMIPYEGTNPNTPVAFSEALAGEAAAEITTGAAAGVAEGAADVAGDVVGEVVTGAIGEIISGS